MKIKKRALSKLNNSLRFHALTLIHQVEFENKYSNVLIDRFLKDSHLSDQDNRLIVQIVYGVIQRRLTLDYYLEPFITGKKIDSWVESLLRMSVYQFIYLDRIPDHAVVNEAVSIAKINGHDGLGKFVNAILRSFKRTPMRELPDSKKNPMEYLSIANSMPIWLVNQLFEWLEKDVERTSHLLASLLINPKLSVRITKDSEQKNLIIQALRQEGITAIPSEISDFGLIIQEGNVIESEQFRIGNLTVQDETSMLVAPIGQLSGKESVLDACAAPGGKATHIAQLLTTGQLTALDLSKNKLNKVDEHVNRMGLSQKVITIQADASKFLPKNHHLYDTIYLDAPCSGLGLMRRKPEIKYEKKANDLVELSTIQLEILEHVANLLKPGGTLVYSTCTLAPIENEQLIEKFLKSNLQFELDPITNNELKQDQLLNGKGQIKVWPDQFNTDGFFISRLKKIK